MIYKAGDRVRIKSLDWYNNNERNGNVYLAGWFNFIKTMAVFCGKIVTIKEVQSPYSYHIFEDEGIHYYTDEMIAGLVEEEVTTSEPQFRVSDVPLEKEMEWNLPDGYEFRDENGNVIKAKKIVLEKLVVPKFKKGDKIKDKNNSVWYVVQVGDKHFDISRIPDGPGYFVPIEDQDDYELSPNRELPKTFEECVHVLEGENRMSLEQMNTFRKLIDARNAYWKIAGEEMGLGNPWEPDWSNPNHDSYPTITKCGGKVIRTTIYTHDCPLAFPTEEMRDAFYENFKKDIEICKELL